MKGGVCEEIECEREISSNGSESVESVAFGTASFASLETWEKYMFSGAFQAYYIRNSVERPRHLCFYKPS